MSPAVNVGCQGDPFYDALQQAQVWLQNAHRAVLGTMEAELKHMRYENMRLRGILEEAGLGEKTKSVFGPGGSPQTPQVESKVTMDATTSCDDLETTETFRPPHATAATTGPDPRQVSVSTVTPTSTQWITMKTEGRSATSTPSTSTPTTPATDGFVKAGWNVPEEETASPSPAAAVSEALPTRGAARTPVAKVPMEKILQAMLAQYGWQHVEAEVLSESPEVSLVSLGGVKLKVRMDYQNGSRGHLMAWEEETSSWQAWDALIRKKRLHKVVRACPVAATREFTIDEDQASPRKAAKVVNASEPVGTPPPRGPLTLAQLEALPEPSRPSPAAVQPQRLVLK